MVSASGVLSIPRRVAVSDFVSSFKEKLADKFIYLTFRSRKWMIIAGDCHELEIAFYLAIVP
jgi:hypothetical protein